MGTIHQPPVIYHVLKPVEYLYPIMVPHLHGISEFPRPVNASITSSSMTTCGQNRRFCKSNTRRLYYYRISFPYVLLLSFLIVHHPVIHAKADKILHSVVLVPHYYCTIIISIQKYRLQMPVLRIVRDPLLNVRQLQGCTHALLLVNMALDNGKGYVGMIPSTILLPKSLHVKIL